MDVEGDRKCPRDLKDAQLTSDPISLVGEVGTDSEGILLYRTTVVMERGHFESERMVSP